MRIEITKNESSTQRRDHQAHEEQLEKVREIAVCIGLKDETGCTWSTEELGNIQSEIWRRIGGVAWEVGIPAISIRLLKHEVDAEKMAARRAGHRVVAVLPLEAGEETHGIEITGVLTRQGERNAAAVQRRMYRLEALAGGGQGVVETIEPLAWPVSWGDETRECDALEPTVRKLLQMTLDQIQLGTADLSGDEGETPES